MIIRKQNSHNIRLISQNMIAFQFASMLILLLLFWYFNMKISFSLSAHNFFSPSFFRLNNTQNSISRCLLKLRFGLILESQLYILQILIYSTTWLRFHFVEIKLLLLLLYVFLGSTSFALQTHSFRAWFINMRGICDDLFSSNHSLCRTILIRYYVQLITNNQQQQQKYSILNGFFLRQKKDSTQRNTIWYYWMKFEIYFCCDVHVVSSE